MVAPIVLLGPLFSCDRFFQKSRQTLGGLESLRKLVTGVAGLCALAVAVGLVIVSRDLDGLWHAVGDLSPAALFALCALLSVGILLASLRLRLVALDIGYQLSLRDSIAAVSVGQIAGALAFPIVGQLVGRGALLAQRQVPFAGTALMMAYERAAGLSSSLLLATVGAVYLFGTIHFGFGLESVNLFKITIGVLVSCAVGAWLVWGGEAARSFRRIRWRHAGLFFRTLLLSFLVQWTTLVAYVLCAKLVEPGMPILDVFAASALVMFAASVPISFAGFGLREMSAVLALQTIGMSRGEALAVALEIGALSLIIVGAFALATRMRRTNLPTFHDTSPPATVVTTVDYSKGLGWVLALSSATLVFFQVYLPTDNGLINVNLADPVAIVGGLSMVALYISRRKLPQLRASFVGPALLAMTAVIFISFAIGVASFGWTQWAATNKLLGWFVLLAYGATGTLAIQIGGKAALERILHVIATTGAATVALQLVALSVSPDTLENVRAEGFAQNANAYAWQMLMVIASLGALSRARYLTLLFALAVSGLWLSGSRAGLGAGFILLWTIYISNHEVRRPIIRSLMLSVLIFLAVAAMPAVISGLEHAVSLLLPGPQAWAHSHDGVMPTLSQLAPAFLGGHYDQASENEHLVSMKQGWHMFLEHPIFGSGLGAFIHNHSTLDNGRGLIIHSTPLWLLAECGLVGATIFAIPFCCLLIRELRDSPKTEAGHLLIFIMVAFGVMSLAHELMYQRMFWLLLGAAIGCTSSISADVPGRLHSRRLSTRALTA
jgi:uncharacterized membrane protein YbhN (UPF0104 family)